jgi:tetratricopeptide (TPR) repeat protein
MNLATGSGEHANAALLAQALAFHQYNHLPQACSLYRKILADEPRHPEALHMLGVALMQQGKHGDGIELIRDALEQNPTPAMWLNLGSGLAQLQRHEDAITALNQALELAPDNPEALNNLGVALAATGHHEQALHQFARALRLRGDFAACHSNRANSLRVLHRVNDAIRAAEHALRLQPDNPDTLNCLGMALTAALREEEALECFNKALRLRPAHDEALTNRARLLRRRQCLDLALADYTLLLEQQQGNPRTHNDIGLTLHQLGRHAEALVHFETALTLTPNVADLHNNRGNCLAALGRTHEALASFESAIALDARHVEALNNKANTLLTLGHGELALPLAEKVCQLAPGLPQGHNNRGLALAACNRHAEALDAFDQTLILRPDYPEALNNRGLALEALGQTLPALRDYARALSCQPEHPLARWNKAQAHLRLGNFAAGWADYDARHRLPGSSTRREFDMPSWQGEPLCGRSILLWTEAETGDTILFCRYASTLAKLGATVLLEIPATMEAVMASLDGVKSLIRQGATLPPADYQCRLADLPARLGTLVSTIPAALPYLSAPAEQLGIWHARIPQRAQRIAIICSSATQFSGNSHCTLGLANFTPLLDPAAQAYLLQADSNAEDVATLAAHPEIVDLRPQCRDFSDLAAALCCMDLVIGTDSAASRLAGALNRPLWLLLPERADWCWLQGRRDSPWYPNARLFRQHVAGDWRRVIAQVSLEMRKQAL